MFDEMKSRPGLLERFSIRWCRMMHDAPMWPIRGHYLCRACGRSFQVPWATEPAAPPVRICVRSEQRVVGRAA